MAHGNSPEEVQRHVKVYIAVFAALAVLTVVTVAVSYLGLNPLQAFLVALTIASVKGLLVAAYFMHLISERKIIFWILFLTFLFLAVLLLTPAIAPSLGRPTP